MLEQVEQYRGAKGIELPESRRHARYWEDRLCATAQRSSRVPAVSTDQAARAVRIRGVPEDLIVIPTGSTGSTFAGNLTAGERLTLLRHWLVDDLRGWDESGREGTVRYSFSRPVSPHRLHGAPPGSAVRRLVHGSKTTVHIHLR
jgi:hypothetical protein